MSRYLKIIIAYLLIAFFVMRLMGLRDEYAAAKLKAYNNIPNNSFDDLAAFTQGVQKLDPQKLDAYLAYTDDVLRYDPKRADAWGISGFCLAQKGDYKKALFSYLQAVSIEPDFFGFHYNLAWLYFKTKQYDQAVGEVQKALLCDPRKSLVYILSASKIYALMMIARINHGVSAEEQLKRGYEKAYQLMAASQYRLKMGMPFPGEDDIQMEGF